MGENGGKWGKMGENGEEMGRKWGERGPVAPPKFPYFPPFFPISPPFSPIFPHFPPFSPISPHFSLPWVHCGYVCGYSTRSRVLLSPDAKTPPLCSLLGLYSKFHFSPKNFSGFGWGGGLAWGGGGSAPPPPPPLDVPLPLQRPSYQPRCVRGVCSGVVAEHCWVCAQEARGRTPNASGTHQS